MTGDREDKFIGGAGGWSCKFSWISIPNLHATIHHCEETATELSDTLLIRMYVYANEGITRGRTPDRETETQ